jgi:hypothetical protein
MLVHHQLSHVVQTYFHANSLHVSMPVHHSKYGALHISMLVHHQFIPHQYALIPIDAGGIAKEHKINKNLTLI